MSAMLFDLEAAHSKPVLCAVLITVYNQLADQDQGLALQMVEDLPSFRYARRPLAPLPGANKARS